MLKIERVTKSFGGLDALKDLSICVEKGDILGLIGPNGAGKSVLVNSISGFARPERGVILFNGENVIGLRPDIIAKRGIGRTFQLANLFFDNTARENVLLGLQKYSKIGLMDVFVDRRANTRKQNVLEQKALELLKFVGLVDLLNGKVRNIPYGLQRRLSFAIALASNPVLLLLDEPFVGLNPLEVNEVLELVSKAHSSGITLLLIEHNMKVIKSLCNRVVVLNFGEKIAEGSPEEIEQNRAVIEAYFGG